jgi:hypothetical protein
VTVQLAAHELELQAKAPLKLIGQEFQADAKFRTPDGSVTTHDIVVAKGSSLASTRTQSPNARCLGARLICQIIVSAKFANIGGKYSDAYTFPIRTQPASLVGD